MKIHFTNQGTIQNFRHFTQTLDFSDPDSLQISLDTDWINVNPAQLVLAAALALKTGKAHSSITGKAPTSARYLDRMGLYSLTSTPSPFSDYIHKEPSGRFIPLAIINNSTDQSKFVSDIIPLYHLDERNSRILSYIIGELVRNVLEHSRSSHGAVVAAQYYKDSNRISFAICDTGIGLWRALQIWHPHTDRDALQLALTPGVSGTTKREGGTPDNVGAGLFFTKSIAKTSRGYFVIYSGNSVYTLLKTRPDIKHPKLYADPFQDHHSFTDAAPRLDGTLVAVDLRLDQTQEFQELFSRIGTAYDHAVRERKQQRFRTPNFI